MLASVIQRRRERQVRQQAERALKLSEERYAAAMSVGTVGVWDWNEETGELYLDPALKRMLGFEDHEIEIENLRDWQKRYYPGDRERVQVAARAHIAGETSTYQCEYRMVHKDGSLRWFYACGTAYRDDNGKAYRMVGTDTDITEQKRAAANREELLAPNRSETRILFALLS